MKYSMITTVAALAGTVACNSGSSIGGLDAEVFFDINLLPANEVPAPKSTPASGNAQLVLFPERVDFQLSAALINGIRSAHIHNGAPGTAGPIVVTLFLPTEPTGPVDGIFAFGTLTDANLPSNVSVESLQNLLLGGNAYIDVHTTSNPGGEIRGQVR